jgi:hypothetical protein
VAPSLTVHFLKENDRVPGSIAGFGGYEKDFFSSDFLEQLDLELSSNSFLLGGILYDNYVLSPKVELVMFSTLGYVTTDLKSEDGAGNSASATENITTIGFGASFGIRHASGNLITLTPGVTLNDGDATLSIALGFVFPRAGGKSDSQNSE